MCRDFINISLDSQISASNELEHVFFFIETRCYLQAIASVGSYICQQRRVIRHCKKLYTTYDLFGLYAYILQPYDLHSGIDALILSTLYILLEQVHIATFLCRLLTFPNYFGAHVPKTIWWLSPEGFHLIL
jgi:hypothetical protein